MAFYALAFEPQALAWLRKQPKAVREQIGYDLYQLQRDQELPGVKRLTNVPHDPPLLRLRSGDYRIAYFLKDDVLMVVVVTIADRKEIYQRLKQALKRPKKA